MRIMVDKPNFIYNIFILYANLLFPMSIGETLKAFRYSISEDRSALSDHSLRFATH